MKYIKISKTDIANGIGVRVVLWTSGCSHHCPECHNPETWDHNAGKKFDENAKAELFLSLSPSYISGITFSGGDPLNEYNVEEVLSLIKEMKEKFPDKNIWLYTGYTWEEIMEESGEEEGKNERKNKEEDLIKIRKEIIENVDILVDGRFINALKDFTLKWKGSSNQRVIDVQKSLKEGKVKILV